MAHVLLPCDLPSWPEVQGLLRGLQGDGRQVARTMETLLDACATCLDPDESRLPDDRPAIRELVRFLEEGALSEGERDALARLAAVAGTLQRPSQGFNYSLRGQEGVVCVERDFCACVVANAFFSTFPRRTPTSHPTLADFRFAPFFAHLHRRSHRKKLKAFLRFFENLDEKPQGQVTLNRKVFSSPGTPLFPKDDNPFAFQKAFYCPSQSIGDVLNSSSAKETKLFFGCPELLVVLCCVETLLEDEALFVEVTDANSQVNWRFCFSDSLLYPAPEPTPLVLSESVDSRKGSSGALPKVHIPRQHSQRSHNSSRLSSRTRSSESGHTDEFVTADEESDDGSRASSLGFVLGGGGSSHERLGDFRRRIGRRTRRRHCRRRSMSLGSSCDMDDITEDPEEHPTARVVRPTSSEPSLVAISDPFPTRGFPALSPAAETALMRTSRRPMVVSSSGHPKAYSHDGVRPNLPVPFRARFRNHRESQDSTDDSRQDSSQGMRDFSLDSIRGSSQDFTHDSSSGDRLDEDEGASSSCDSLASSSSSCSEA